MDMGMSKVLSDGYWGIINRDGKEIVSPKYEKIKSFENNRAKVSLKGKWGVIDRNGKEIVKVN